MSVPFLFLDVTWPELKDSLKPGTSPQCTQKGLQWKLPISVPKSKKEYPMCQEGGGKWFIFSFSHSLPNSHFHPPIQGGSTGKNGLVPFFRPGGQSLLSLSHDPPATWTWRHTDSPDMCSRAEKLSPRLSARKLGRGAEFLGSGK
jgi:hypothetical protein